MPIPTDFSFSRYLAAKKTVDDRALNLQVAESFAEALKSRPQSSPLNVLEVGCGLGTMVERLLDRGLLEQADYTGVDLNLELLREAEKRLVQYAGKKGWQTARRKEGGFALTGPSQNLTVTLEAVDALKYAGRMAGQRSFDVLLAHSFLDLVDLDAALPRLLALLDKGGLFYFTLNFDGVTAFLPVIDPALDRRIEDLYHETMDRRRVGGSITGGSRTGRRLFGVLGSLRVEILAAGSSDWLVWPQAGAYPEDEAYFLHFIIHTMQEALTGHPGLDQEVLGKWIKARQAQVERGELVYLAHQLDFLGSPGGAFDSL